MQLRRPNLPLTRVVPLTLPLTRLTHASHTHTHAHTHVHNPLSTNPMNRTPPFVPPPTSAAQSVAIIRRMAFPRPTVVSFPRPDLDLHIVLRAPNVTQHRRGAARMQLLAPTPQPPHIPSPGAEPEPAVSALSNLVGGLKSGQTMFYHLHTMSPCCKTAKAWRGCAAAHTSTELCCAWWLTVKLTYVRSRAGCHAMIR